jgi:hypothetical protein
MKKPSTSQDSSETLKRYPGVKVITSSVNNSVDRVKKKNLDRELI